MPSDDVGFLFLSTIDRQNLPTSPKKESSTMTTNNPFPQPICDQIWREKYKLTTSKPDVKNDESVQDTWMRIATACATYDDTIDGQKRDQFYNALKNFKWLPAGRITSGAGSKRNVTLFNCFVMGNIPDSMAGIFDMLKEAALTMQQGGGIGYDFSPLRPKDAPVKGVDADASGPLTFMDVWDAMCRTWRFHLGRARWLVTILTSKHSSKPNETQTGFGCLMSQFLQQIPLCYLSKKIWFGH